MAKVSVKVEKKINVVQGSIEEECINIKLPKSLLQYLNVIRLSDLRWTKLNGVVQIFNEEPTLPILREFK